MDEEEDSILTVCNAVRQLLYDCGNELGWCFTEVQVSETRFKQREGLETILAEHYSKEKLELCFVQENTPELVNIKKVLENQTVRSRDSTESVVKTVKKDTAGDISENIISESGDRTPRVLPSSKHSSHTVIRPLSFLSIISLVLTVSVSL